MNIACSDGRDSIELGGYETWQALSSTIVIRLEKIKEKIPLVLQFIESEKCKNIDCLETARQFNIVKDELSQMKPDMIVYDAKNLDKPVPWGTQISPTITSCGNYFTSGDGHDLLSEIVRIFTISAYSHTDIIIT